MLTHLVCELRPRLVRALRPLLLLGLAGAGLGCGVLTDEIVPGDSVSARFRLTWTMEDATTGMKESCALAGADWVRVHSHNLDAGHRFLDFFLCEDAVGLTRLLTAGHYEVTPELVYCGSDDACTTEIPLGSVGEPLHASIFEEGDHDLGAVVFTVPPGGS